jgi:L(+)-tartrate dehydratase beta subunit
MKKDLYTPIKPEDIMDLHIGDIVYLNGTLVTGRDDVLRRVLYEHRECPVDFTKAAIFHGGPIIKTLPDGTYECVAVGPTSSIRMENDQADFIKVTGLRMIIGKGGMGDKTARGCKQYKCIHCVFPGGCAVKGATMVEKVEGVKWPELGMPEALWIFKVRHFGPLIVSIDTHGNNLFTQNLAQYQARVSHCEAPIIDSVREYQKI